MFHSRLSSVSLLVRRALELYEVIIIASKAYLIIMGMVRGNAAVYCIMRWMRLLEEGHGKCRWRGALRRIHRVDYVCAFAIYSPSIITVIGFSPRSIDWSNWNATSLLICSLEREAHIPFVCPWRGLYFEIIYEKINVWEGGEFVLCEVLVLEITQDALLHIQHCDMEMLNKLRIMAMDQSYR